MAVENDPSRLGYGLSALRRRAKCGRHSDATDASHISGGDEADGVTGDGAGLVVTKRTIMDENHDDDKNSEEEPDLADSALGPEDGEGEGDET